MKGGKVPRYQHMIYWILISVLIVLATVAFMYGIDDFMANVRLY